MEQDWKPVTLQRRGHRAGSAAASSSRSGATERKFAAAENKSAHSAVGVGVNMRKLEEDTESFSHATVGVSLRQAIQKARLDKKMNQKQLAQMINEKASVINDYESGKAIPNPAIINKIERVLGCRLPRPKKNKK